MNYYNGTPVFLGDYVCMSDSFNINGPYLLKVRDATGYKEEKGCLVNNRVSIQTLIYYDKETQLALLKPTPYGGEPTTILLKSRQTGMRSQLYRTINVSSSGIIRWENDDLIIKTLVDEGWFKGEPVNIKNENGPINYGFLEHYDKEERIAHIRIK